MHISLSGLQSRVVLVSSYYVFVWMNLVLLPRSVSSLVFLLSVGVFSLVFLCGVVFSRVLGVVVFSLVFLRGVFLSLATH